jgi:hypothetical protein
LQQKLTKYIQKVIDKSKKNISNNNFDNLKVYLNSFDCLEKCFSSELDNQQLRFYTKLEKKLIVSNSTAKKPS